MNKALEKLGKIYKCKESAYWHIVETKLKALKFVVKKARIKLGKMNGLYYFETSNTTYYISKEKYDLLKEALKDE